MNGRKFEMREVVKVNVKDKADVSPVAMLVQLASKFESEIYIEDGSKHFNAKSIMGMMTLGLEEGKELSLVATGSDETEAVEEIAAYLRS
jgi:catabolite repression HPr-like protein